MVCFDIKDGIKCEVFDGLSLTQVSSTKHEHWMGELSIYNGRPTAIGGDNVKGLVETFSDGIWTALPPHPG